MELKTFKNCRLLPVTGSFRRETSPHLKAWLLISVRLPDILSKHWQGGACKYIGMLFWVWPSTSARVCFLFIWGAAVVALMFDSGGWLLSPIHVDQKNNKFRNILIRKSKGASISLLRSRWNMIIQVSVFVDSDQHFDNLCSNGHQKNCVWLVEGIKLNSDHWHDCQSKHILMVHLSIKIMGQIFKSSLSSV